MLKHLLSILFLFASNILIQGQVIYTEIGADAGVQLLGKNYGAAVGDYDNDGWDDIFALTQDAPCRLYHNNGDGTFDDRASALGLDYVGTPSCAGWADVNNDGWLDLLIANRDETNRFYLANGDGTFTENTFLSGLMSGGQVRALLFADVNLDGNIDIYLARLNMENILYLNIGGGKFINYTQASGALDNQISMGAVFFDYDNDGDPDLYLTHDANQPFILYQNDGQGHFTDVSVPSGANVAAMGMGVDIADINQDGWMDIYVTNLSDNSLLVNNGDGTFSEIGASAGVNDVGMGWGCGFLDADNDSWPDLYAANDSYFAPTPNVFYQNKQNETFENIAEGSPLSSMEPGYGVVTSDFNNDGQVDMYLANYIGTTGNQLFQNQSNTANHWVKIKLAGTESNRSAIGARVSLQSNGTLLTDELVGTSGYASQSSFTMHFGLGQSNLIDVLTIRWPSGLVETYEDLEVDVTYSFTEGNGFITAALEASGNQLPPAEIYPNPVSDVLNLGLELKKRQELKMTIYSVFGNVVDQVSFGLAHPGKQVFSLPVSELPVGVYYLKLSIGAKIQILKFVKNN